MEPLDVLGRGVTLFLGGLAQASYKLFKSLGVDMAGVDEVLAAWTDWSHSIQAQLADALAVNEQLVATDAEEDAAQAAALQAEFAAKVQAAYDTATAPPEPPEPEPVVPDPSEPVVEPEPETPVDPELVTPEVDPVSPQEPVTLPADLTEEGEGTEEPSFPDETSEDAGAEVVPDEGDTTLQ